MSNKQFIALTRGLHSMEASYQKLLENTIQTLLSNDKSNVQSILANVFESLMKVELDLFLSASYSTNKGNGFYQCFVNHFKGVMKLLYLGTGKDYLPL